MYVVRATCLEGLPFWRRPWRTGESGWTVCKRRLVYAIDLETADGARQAVARLYGDCAAETQPGDLVRVAARFFEEEPTAQDLSDGVLLKGYAETLLGRAEPEGTPLWLHLRHANERLTESIKTAVPGWRGDMVAAISIAGGDPLPYEISRDFSRSGVAHMLSLSGMHLSIVSFLMLGCCESCGCRTAPRISSSVPRWWVYRHGLRPSVLRAGVMLLVYYLGLAFGRQRDSLNSLGFAALVAVNINPYNAIDAGFLLSFSATLGILLFQPKVCLLLEKGLVKCRVPCAKLHFLIECMAVTVSAVFLSAPVSIPVFGQISLVGFFVNLAAAFLAPVMIGCGLLCALTGLVPFLAFASNGLGFVAGLCAWAMRKICGFCAWLPFAVAPAGMEFIYLWLGGSLVLFGVRTAL
ncbi:MAG: ComEC/Rec2 family competence protein [Oscillospiraceae bacterium]